MITREKENSGLGNHHYGTAEWEYWNYHGKLIYNFWKFILYMVKALGTQCSCPQGDPWDKDTPIKGN